MVSMWGEDDTLLLSESTVILYPRLGGGGGAVQLIVTVSTPVCSVVRWDGGSPVLRWLKKRFVDYNKRVYIPSMLI